MDGTRATPVSPRVLIRSYRDADQPQVARLYAHGLLVGVPDRQDAPADIGSIAQSYFSSTADHFWVAQSGERLVGMIAVKHEPGGVSRIRRLRVDRLWQGTDLAARLIDTALDHCRRNGDVKVILDTHVRAEEALAHLQRRGFQHARNRKVDDRERMEFYVDLYHKPDSADLEFVPGSGLLRWATI